MKTNNFYNMVKIYSMSAYLGFSNTAGLEEDFPIRRWNGNVLQYTDYSTNCTYTNLIKNNILTDPDNDSNKADAMGRISFPYGTNGTSSNYGYKPAFVFGSSTTPESALDYCLGTKFTKNDIRTNVVNTEKEHGVVESLVTITNITGNSITINEIGLVLGAIGQSYWIDDSDFNQGNRIVLIERRVLSSPVTIGSNESISLVIKTGLEEDLEATVVTP